MAEKMAWVIQLPCFICLLMHFLNLCYSLCAGAVIHFIHSNEMKDMGGLRKFMPVTHIAFLIACLAIAGIPRLQVFSVRKKFYWQLTINKLFITLRLSLLVTAFYMFRLYFSIFWNKHEVHYHVS